MRILIADPEEPRQRRAVAQLRNMTGVRVCSVCADLTGTFDEVEHRPPDMVLISPKLARLPEFETMEALFRMLKVKWMPLLDGAHERAFLNGTSPASARHGFDLTSSPRVTLENLRAELSEQSNKAAEAGAGLLRSLDKAVEQRVVLIGSSTGGVDALLQVLGSFPIDCPPTLIVQHTGSAFSTGLARLLDRNVAPHVREAADNDKPEPGVVLLAPGTERHLKLRTGHHLRCRLEDAPPQNGHRPSVDALFRSAVPIAKKVTAAILTGMGKDGADGLLELRKAGAVTIAQDKKTSVVYGMPRHATENGAAQLTLPIGSVGSALLKPNNRVRP